MDQKKTDGNVRIAALFDAGTFVETNAYLKRNGDSENYEGVISGYGAVNGKLAFAFLQDGERMKGAFDATAAKKIAALYDTAMKNGAPVIGIFDCAGAVVTEGSAVLGAYGEFLASVSGASGVIPQIAIVTGNCTGMCAVAVSMFDIVATVKGTATVSFHPAFNVGAQSAEDAKAYVSDLDAENESAAFASVRSLVDLLPSNNAEGVAPVENNDDVNRTVAVGTVKETMTAVADMNRVTVLEEACEDGVVTALCRIGGVTAGLIGYEGEMNACGAKKAAWFEGVCDSFGIPTVSFVDSVGADRDPEENPALAPALATLASVNAMATAPRIAVVTGKAYGVAFTVPASKALGCDLTLALPEAYISPMSPAAAVAFLCNDTAADNRAKAETEWAEKNASATVAAGNGDVDDIIEPSELRQRLCAAVYMLMKKSVGTPARKHRNLPL